MSSPVSSTKKTCTTTAAPNLITVLFRKGGGFSIEIVRTITALLTFKKMSSLVSITKEAYEAKLILFKAPKEWVDGDEVRMMFRAMLGTAETRWNLRIDTSPVETLMLGVKRYFDRNRTNVVTGAWLRFLEKKKFPNLNSLCFNWCINITDASLVEVIQRYLNLQTLNLDGCGNITDASVMEVARECSNLQTLSLSGSNITDASVMEVARRCSNLQTLNLRYCMNITDTSVMEVARRCSNLRTLNLGACSKITDASVMELARRCSKLQTLDLEFCDNFTSACKNSLRQSHPQLELDD
jgi:hypothetical protein